ncbi:MAG: OadG family protein [Nitrospina sp.]|nr:OadG family protein [Nitrospina sp.]
MVGSAIKVSFIAMGVIFLVLTILIGLIQILVKLIPYEAPPAPPAKPQAAAGPDEGETVAAIHAAVARHRGQTPESIQITHIQPR